MAYRIVLRFPEMVAENWHDKLGCVRNLGEEIFRVLRDGDAAEISIQEVDRATDTLTVDVRKSRNLKSILKLLERLSDEHFPEQSPAVTVTKT
jgi:hypothetical protein